MPLLRNVNDLESALRNQRSHCKSDITSNYHVYINGSYVKRRNRLKVLLKLYYLQRDISAALVEAAFKLMKVQRKTVT